MRLASLPDRAPRDAHAVIGAVLEGAESPSRTLAGRPLHAWAEAALAEVCEPVTIVPFDLNPLTGVVDALERAGAAVLVCRADMPFVTPDACRTLLEAAGTAAGPAVVAAAAGELQPALGLYAPAALDVLRGAPDDTSLESAVEELHPVKVALPPALVQTVTTPDELAEAATRLR
jgi:CTP:molybdopterin cytidylyltransferase MocA